MRGRARGDAAERGGAPQRVWRSTPLRLPARRWLTSANCGLASGTPFAPPYGSLPGGAWQRAWRCGGARRGAAVRVAVHTPAADCPSLAGKRPSLAGKPHSFRQYFLVSFTYFSS